MSKQQLPTVRIRTQRHNQDRHNQDCHKQDCHKQDRRRFRGRSLLIVVGCVAVLAATTFLSLNGWHTSESNGRDATAISSETAAVVVGNRFPLETDAVRSAAKSDQSHLATVPKTTVPKTTGPKTTGPKTTGPKTTGPKTTGPKATHRGFASGRPAAFRTRADTEPHTRETIDSQSSLRLERLLAELAVGEFGPALETAESTNDARERTRLFQLVASAQIQASAFDAARRTIHRIPIPDERVRTQRRFASQRGLSGGGPQADFGGLIELIESETSGPWLEIDGVGGTITEYETGVAVDPNGLLGRLTRDEHSDRLNKRVIAARVADLNEDMARFSELRLVSLTRIEKRLVDRMATGRPVAETMQHLAGLTRIQYVFIDTDANDILIGGPAEGWRFDQCGIAVGASSGVPTLQLDDLVTLLRTFSDDGRQAFGCSINPRKVGLKRIKQFVEQSHVAGPLPAGTAIEKWTQQLQQCLGPQDVEFYGVPHDSRVARVIVEADYRMKLIGIGKLDGGKNIPNVFDLLTDVGEQQASLDALRWMLAMKYASILHSPDRNVFEIRGPAVRCQSENQFVTAQGDRIQTGKSDAANRNFAANFTQNYAELAERDAVFADLQNIFDIALVAALLHNERAADRIGWSLGVFVPNGNYRPARYEPPKTVESVVNHRIYAGREIVVQVAGGVRGDAMSIVKNRQAMRVSPRLRLIASQARSQRQQSPNEGWWWDAAPSDH